MANQKRFTQGYTTGGNVPNICIQRDADSFFWNGSAFVANGGAPYVIAMTEKYDGFWEYETSAAVWDNGTYNITIYDSASSTSAVLSAYSLRIVGDTIMDGVALTSLAARNASASLSSSLKNILTGLAGIEKKVGVLESKVDSFGIQLLRE